jgi:hypothetical protein
MEIIWGRFVEKTGGQKSRATVPLREQNSAGKKHPGNVRSSRTFILYSLQ